MSNELASVQSKALVALIITRYTFGVALEPPCKLLPLEEAGAVPNKVQTIVACLLEAAQYWALLLPNWPLREDFCDWAMRLGSNFACICGDAKFGVRKVSFT